MQTHIGPSEQINLTNNPAVYFYASFLPITEKTMPATTDTETSTDTQNFKKAYRSKYTDIKINIEFKYSFLI